MRKELSSENVIGEMRRVVGVTVDGLGVQTGDWLGPCCLDGRVVGVSSHGGGDGAGSVVRGILDVRRRS
jgi:hypothetical protein